MRLLSIGVLIFSVLTTAAHAEPATPETMAALGQIDHLCQQRRWEEALHALGELPKATQDSTLVKQYLSFVAPRVYKADKPKPKPMDETSKKKWRMPSTIVQHRTALRNTDSERQSDHDFDERGRQYNTMFKAEWGHPSRRHLLRGSLDGYQNGVNDLRPRKLTYQFRTDRSRWTFGDVRNYLSRHKVSDPVNPLAEYTGYTIRSAQLRGLDVEIDTGRNQFHAMAGVAPFFFSPRDDTIYPRQIYGIRDSYQFHDRYRAAVAASYVRGDSEILRRINESNQARSTAIIAFEQDVTLIPGHWTINTENAYSVTDDDLEVDRFGQTVKLKDTAHSIFSEWRWPFGRILASYERIGPDFRSPSDVAAVGTINSKNLTADREHIIWRVFPKRIGPLYGNFSYSRSRNDIDDDTEVEMTREHWINYRGGLDITGKWPRPTWRATLNKTINSPGSTFSADKSWTYDVSLDLRKRLWETDFTGGYRFFAINNDDSTNNFDNEYRREFDARIGRRLWKDLRASTRFAYARVQDRFNNGEVRSPYSDREANITLSSGLWSTSSASVGYTYRDKGAPTVIDSSQTPGGAIFNTISTSFAWPLFKRFRHGRTLTLTPSFHVWKTDASDDLQSHYAAGGRLSAKFNVEDKYRVEFRFEYRQDDDAEIPEVSSEETRGWIMITSKFGQSLVDESPFR